MCGCNKDIKDASHLKIYIIMAKYKAKKDIIIIRDGVRFVLRKSSEEQLSYLYEDLRIRQRKMFFSLGFLNYALHLVQQNHKTYQG